jgi:hypothetical protein
MTAATSARLGTRIKCNAADRYRDLEVDTAETVYPGCFAGVRAGKLCDPDVDDDYVVAGVALGKYDEIGAEAAATEKARVSDGVFGPFAQTGTTITIAHVGRRAYIADNQTVTLSTGGATMPRSAGLITDVTSDGVYVETGLALCAMLDECPRVQTGTGVLVAGVLTVTAGVAISANSQVSAVYTVEGGTDGDELRCLPADFTAGEPDAGEFIVRSYLNGAAAGSDTSTVRWTVRG